MDEEEKEMLTNAINNYYSKIKYINKYNSIQIEKIQLLKFINKLNDEKEIKKILIKNEYGIIGSLLYKYKDNIDKDIYNYIYLKDKELSLKIIKKRGTPIKYISEELRNDKEVVLEAVKQNGHTLKYVNEIFKNDKEVVLEAVKQNGHTLKYVNEIFKNDKEVVLAAVKQNVYALVYASEKLRNDKEVVVEAVKQHGYALVYASEKLRNDKEAVLAAVKQDGYALQYVSRELRNDKEVVLEAVKQNGHTLKYASEELNKNCGVVLNGLINSKNLDEDVLKEVCKYFKDDRDMMYEAIKNNFNAVQFIGGELKKNKKFLLDVYKFLPQYSFIFGDDYDPIYNRFINIFDYDCDSIYNLLIEEVRLGK